MMRQVLSRASLAASLLLPALAGCVFHKTSPPPQVAIAPTPEPAPAPLYSLELSQSAPLLPQLPNVPPSNAQPAPPPKSVVEIARKQRPTPTRRTRGRKGETELAERESREREAREKEPAGNNPPAEPGTPAAEGSLAVEKVTAPTPTGDTTQPTSIGQITAGPTQDADASKNQASDLIQNTQRGVNSLHRSLSSDQEKTVAQIRSFLTQAQRAIHNGDVDGAYTLATKAKLLLDELNGST